MASPPLDPESLAKVTKAVVDIYGDAVARMLSLVTARMARGIDEPGWAEAKLLDLVGLRADAQAVVAELAKTGPPAVQKAIAEASETGRVGAARQLGISLVPSTNTAAVEALARETVQSVTAAHFGILRSVDDIYRQVVAEVAAPGVVTGTETTRQAIQRALNRWADVGISGFVDAAGRNWELASYAEMATRTASGRAMIDGRLDVYQADGRDLVIVSDHTQECSLCRPYEGKILSITGATPDGAVLEDGARVAGSLGEARRAGLLHPSCRHDIRPYIVGLTQPFGATEDPEGDRLRQEQRRLERQVRHWKRREAVALDDHARRQASAKVQSWQDRLTRHIDDNDLKRLRYREGARMHGVAPTPKTPPSLLRSEIGRHTVKGRQVAAALDDIAKVHPLPKLRGVTIIDGAKLPIGTRGFFRNKAGVVALGSGRDVGSTLTHELGHAIEARHLGGAGRMLRSDPALASVINSSPEVAQLRHLLATTTDADVRLHTAYLLTPKELWARAYTQWIGVESGSAAIRRDVARFAALPPGHPDRYRQWDPSSFGVIGVEVRRVLRSKGIIP